MFGQTSQPLQFPYEKTQKCLCNICALQELVQGYFVHYCKWRKEQKNKTKKLKTI